MVPPAALALHWSFGGGALVDVTEDKSKVVRRGQPWKPTGEKHAQ